MSEPFQFNCSFSTDSKAQMDTIKDLFEALDCEDDEEARELLSDAAYQQASQQIKELGSRYGNYKNGSDLITMYQGCHADSVADAGLKVGASGLAARYQAEGQDRDAEDFCVAVVLLLQAAGARQINALAQAVCWQARWQSDSHERLQFEYSEVEC